MVSLNMNTKAYSMPAYLSLFTLVSVMVRAIMDIRYMWSDTLSGSLTFRYTHPVRGTRWKKVRGNS